MRRLFTTLAMFSVLLGLGALAVLARVEEGRSSAGFLVAASVVTPTPDPTANQFAVPDAPDATSNFNLIALPLDVRDNWASRGYANTAHGLAQYISITAVSQVLQWNATKQLYDKWYPNSNYGYIGGVYTRTAFSLRVGGAYWLLVNNANPSLSNVSFVGGVPPANSITFTLSGGSPCKFNNLSLPLERSTITNAQGLASSMGGSSNVSQVLGWNAPKQLYDKWYPSSNYGYIGGAFTRTPFTVSIGYPYIVCYSGANGTIWPSSP